MAGQLQEFEGSVSLEGPLLESLFSAYLLRTGHQLVNAIETRGVQHDVLEKLYDGGFIFYECTGQEIITEKKVNRFLNDIFSLDEVLREASDGKGLVKAVFVAAVAEDAWQENAKKALEYVKTKVKQKIGCDVEVISGLELLKELISSGVLGIRLYQNKIYLTGPEDYGIRYSTESGEYRMSTAPINITHFRTTPYSFFPSHYWENCYRELFREAMADKKEEWANEYQIFSYAFIEGLRIGSTEQLVALYRDYTLSFQNRRIISFGDSYVAEHSWSRRNDYYSIHIFAMDPTIGMVKAREMRGKAIMLIDEIREKEKNEKLRFSVFFHTLTEDWSPVAWSVVCEVPDLLKDEITNIYVERGNDLLIGLLNLGILGFRFRNKNKITLVGPGVDAVRLINKSIQISSGKSY